MLLLSSAYFLVRTCTSLAIAALEFADVPQGLAWFHRWSRSYPSYLACFGSTP